MPNTPINYPLVAEAHDEMHVQHKYWSRKPVNVVRAHIEASTQPGEIVLDPFCGSGTTVSQSLLLGRKVLGSDLNPLATFITRNTIARFDVGDLLAIFDMMKAKIATKIRDLYRTRCPVCLSNDTTETICVHWKVHHPIKIWYTCSKCGHDGSGAGGHKVKRLHKVPDSEDLVMLDKINVMEVLCWYPRVEIPCGIVFDQARRDVSRFDELFTKRNLIALSLLRDEIERLPTGTADERSARTLFLYAFTSMVHLCSRMTPIRPSRPCSSFWATNSYWLPRLFMESNVWEKFESAVLGPQGLIAAKMDANRKIPPNTRIVPSFDGLASTSAPCACIIEHDATNVDAVVPPGSIDYIFTDPPYAGSIPYLELSALWSVWLYKDAVVGGLSDGEILVDPARGKDLSTYGAMLGRFFKAAFAVLKQGRYLTFTYHNLDARVRKAILGSGVRAGFEIESIIYQAPPRTSPAHTLRPFNSAVGDYIVHLLKPQLLPGIPVAPSVEKTAGQGLDPACGVHEVESDVVAMLGDILLDRGEPATYTQIINCLDVRMSSKPWYFSSDVDPRAVLKHHTGTRFVQVTEAIGTREGVKWWLAPAFKKELLEARGLQEAIPLTRQIERYLYDNEEKLAGKPDTDIQRAILGEFHGILLPELKFLEKAIKQLRARKKR